MWPDDDQPRFVVDTKPYVRILDRAYCFAVVRHYEARGRKPISALPQAVIAAAHLNAQDRLGVFDRDVTDTFPVGELVHL